MKTLAKIFVLLVVVWFGLVAVFCYHLYVPQVEVEQLIRMACDHDAEQTIGFQPVGGSSRQVGCAEAIQSAGMEVAYLSVTVYSSRAPSLGLFESIVQCKYRADLVGARTTCESYTDAL